MKKSHRLNKKSDKKMKKHLESFYKFQPFECWDLGSHFVKFILPRLKYFKDNSIKAYPVKFADSLTYKEGCELWQNEIDKMIFSFEFFQRIDNQVCFKEGTEDHNLWLQYLKKEGKVYEGLEVFISHITDLWD